LLLPAENRRCRWHHDQILAVRFMKCHEHNRTKDLDEFIFILVWSPSRASRFLVC
jgi:hypothetical protein